MKQRRPLSRHGPQAESRVSRRDLPSACAVSFSATSVINRGDRREPIFKDEADRQRFVETLAEVGAKTGCLCVAHADRAGRFTPTSLPNYFHLVVETPQPNLVAGACVLHGILSLIVAARPMADAGKIAAGCWHGLSSLITLGLLLAYVLRQEGGWFLAAAVLTGFTVIVTLVFALVVKPGGAALKR